MLALAAVASWLGDASPTYPQDANREQAIREILASNAADHIKAAALRRLLPLGMDILELEREFRPYPSYIGTGNLFIFSYGIPAGPRIDVYWLGGPWQRLLFWVRKLL
jgi:hypothetical protein